MKKIILSFTILSLLLQSCKDSQWVIKQKSKELKYSYAQRYYAKQKFGDAIPVIEDLMSYYKGTDTAENLYFMLAECHFLGKEYMVAAYHFKAFRDLYPRSYKSEVASFKIAECYKKSIPRLELEQTDTEKAITYYTSFLSEYPKSAMTEIAEKHLGELKRIMELKALDAANLYYRTGNYRAAATTYKNVINQYPNIAEYEELMYKVGMSYYKFAEQSITTKQSSRYETALNECQNFINRFPKSKHSNEVRLVSDDSKMKILESALKNANTYYNILERPLYYNQALELFEEFSPEIKKLPVSITGYRNKCYLGILRSYYIAMEETKETTQRTEYFQMFLENYYKTIVKFTSRSEELSEAEELFKKINQNYKS
jgi:outer membrane protein assembly factor BamD